MVDRRIRTVGWDDVVEWSEEGQNDRAPGCGRGWAKLAHGRHVGRLFIHASDDSAFEAERMSPQRIRPGRR